MGFFAESTFSVQKAQPLRFPQCGACGLYKSCKTPKMPMSGEGRRRVLICGEGPGEFEDQKGIQFVGKTGQHLEGVLKKLGVDMRRDCWLTNSIICRAQNSSGGNRAPDDNEIAYCRPNLIKTIETLDPDVIIPLGAHAVESLIGHSWKESTGGIFRWAGFVIPCQRPNTWICPTFHPSFLVREESPVADRHFADHLAAAFAQEGKPWADLPDYKSMLRIELDDQEAAKAIDAMRQAGGLVAFDYETDRKKPDHPDSRIVCCSVSDGVVSVGFPWRGRAIEAMRQLIASTTPKTAANKKFEHRWTLRHLGIHPNEWKWDSMLGMHWLDNRQGICGLKFQAFVYLGVTEYNAHIAPFLESADDGGNTPNRIKEVDILHLLEYCAYDSLFQWHVATMQMEQGGIA